MLSDISGKKMFVMDVFFVVIKYMKEYFLYKLSEIGDIEIKKEEIRWVLIVFVIWNDIVKFFMREFVIKVFVYLFLLISLIELKLRFISEVYVRDI